MSDSTAEQTEALTRAVQALKAELDACREQETRYRRLFDATEAACGFAEIILDEGGRPVDYRLLEVNEAFGRLTGFPPEVAEGKTARELVPNLEPHWIETYGKVALTGEPVRFEGYAEGLGGRWFEVLAYSPAPRQFMQVFFDITRQKLTEAKLEQQLRFSQLLLDAIPTPVFYKDANGVYLGCNSAFEAYLGRPRDAIIGQTVYGVAPKHLADIYRQADNELFARGGVQTYESRVRYGDGTEHDVVFYKATFSLSSGAIDGLIGTIFDISERKCAEQALRESEARYRLQATELETVYRSAPIGLAVLDRELRYRRINERLAKLNGVSVEAHLGKTPREVVPALADTIEALGKKVVSTGEAVLNFEVRVATPAQPEAERFYTTHWLPLKDEAGEVWGINVVLEETTERRRLEARARHLAEHDSLTGLPNRRLLHELLEAALRSAQRSRRKVALLFLDLDRFKAINDILGHEAGDALLKEVAARISARVRRSDIVARFGGDEFTVLLSELSQGEQAAEVAAEIVRTFQPPFYLADQRLYITTSVGISLYPDDNDSADGLLRCADMAMYEAKEQGRNTFRFYNPAVDRRARERARIENMLRQALEGGGLRVVYQPELDLRTGRLVGLEALVRWLHPELGLLDPSRFIPVAEETDLIVALDDWVLSAACAQARRWLDQGLPPLSIGINLSAKRFERPDLVEAVHRHLDENRLAPAHLELELTERTVMRRIDQSIERMRELVALGVCIAVDDFGTGYSSLSYLKRLPIHKLKIDQSFVHDIATDADNRAIVQAVTALAHNLSKRVIAEGVETEAQRQFLTATGCDEAQGFLFTRPLPPEQLVELLLH